MIVADGTLIAIGDVQLSVKDGTGPSGWSRRHAWSWPAQAVTEGYAVRQHTGREATLEVEGTAFADLLADVVSPEVRLRELADRGEPVDVVLGSGAVLGLHVVLSVGERVERSWPDGTPRQLAWRVSLARVDEPVAAPDPRGARAEPRPQPARTASLSYPTGAFA